MEEFEAVDWYNQRVDACKDPELKAILEHNRDLRTCRPISQDTGLRYLDFQRVTRITTVKLRDWL